MEQSLLYLGAGLIVLIVGAEFMVRGAARLAIAMGLPSLFVGLTIVAFATSSPELVVAIEASLRGAQDLAMGNVVGSNICNVGLILGITALVKPIPCNITVVRREVPLVIGVSLLFWLLAVEGLTRIESAVLVGCLVLYSVWAYFSARHQQRRRPAQELTARKLSVSAFLRNLGLVVLGLGGLVLGAKWLVNGATSIAETLGWSDALIGATVVAVGTSLPEVATSIVAAFRGEPDIAVGNVLGSNLWNLLGVAGIAGMITGLPVGDPSLLQFDIPVMVLFACASLPIMAWKGVITRLEGLVLLLGYGAYACARLTLFA